MGLGLSEFQSWSKLIFRLASHPIYVRQGRVEICLGRGASASSSSGRVNMPVFGHCFGKFSYGLVAHLLDVHFWSCIAVQPKFAVLFWHQTSTRECFLPYAYHHPDPGLQGEPDILAGLIFQESLEDVIKPTVKSVQIAMTTYERQGGRVNLIVCDDGLQLLSEPEARDRMHFYATNDLAFVARPPHGVDGFERRGKFKKVSNM